MGPTEPKSVWNVAAELGEGPVWVERDRALWFTDIKKSKIHRYDPAGGKRETWDSPEQVGFVLPAQGGGFIAGLMSGLHRFDETTGRFTLIAEVEPERPNNRLNDGTVDPRGRLWFGTMDNGETGKTGAFYRFERGAVTPAGIEGVAITNGPALSPDGRILYFVD
ncbi:MAG TPA: SMP-30/gluconolactonase/LRE family protein, partial [Allosphingosinicella sp.]|nr:SMP-30/gluconolactonase/LRE family protein [Allosphingosinicella sp.]